jgi:hypothetical protein
MAKGEELVIKSNNSGMAKVKIVKNERDPPLCTGKLLIKFQNILKNTTQVIIGFVYRRTDMVKPR